MGISLCTCVYLSVSTAEFTGVPARLQLWNVLAVKKLEDKMKRRIDGVGGMKAVREQGCEI